MNLNKKNNKNQWLGSEQQVSVIFNGGRLLVSGGAKTDKLGKETDVTWNFCGR